MAAKSRGQPDESWDGEKTVPATPGDSPKSNTDLFLEKRSLNIEKLGEFRIVREVGRGSMGVVYEAVQENLRRRVALKILPQSVNLDRKTLRRFLREAESLANLDHPNIVPIYGTGMDKGIHYYAMQFIEGPTLARRNECEDIDFEEAGRLAADVAWALQCAHERGIVHRDIKPANLICSQSSGKVMITDFGLARDESAGTITESGTLIGTPMYMSPEQVTGTQRGGVDRLSDIYSLGATLYETLTGTPPFKAESFQATLHKIAEEDPRPPRKIDPRVPKDLETIVMTAMHKDRRRRYSSARDLAEDLERYLKREPVHARPTTVLERGARRLGKHRTPLLIGSAIVVPILIAVFAFGLVSKKTTRRVEDYLTAFDRARAAAEEARFQSRIAESTDRASVQWKKVETEFDEVIAIDPSRAKGYLGRGQARSAQGDPMGALKDFNRALDLEPENRDAYVSRGRLYTEMEAWDQARKDLTNARILDPDHSEALALLGLVEYEQKNYSRARQHLEHARKVSEKDPRVHSRLGLVYIALEEYTLAEESLQLAHQLVPKDQSITGILNDLQKTLHPEEVESGATEADLLKKAGGEAWNGAQESLSDIVSGSAGAGGDEAVTGTDLLSAGTELFRRIGKPILTPLLPLNLDGEEPGPVPGAEDPDFGQELDVAPPYLEGLSNLDILGLATPVLKSTGESLAQARGEPSGQGSNRDSTSSSSGGDRSVSSGGDTGGLQPNLAGIRRFVETLGSTFYTPMPSGGDGEEELDTVDRSLAELDQLLAENPTPEDFAHRGDLRWKQKNDLTGAEADYRAGHALDDQNLEVLRRLSLFLVVKAETSPEDARAEIAEEATRLAEKAAELAPEDPDVQFTRGRSYYVAGRIDDAIKTISELISKHTDSPSYRTYLEEAARYHDAKKNLNPPADPRR